MLTFKKPFKYVKNWTIQYCESLIGAKETKIKKNALYIPTLSNYTDSKYLLGSWLSINAEDDDLLSHIGLQIVGDISKKGLNTAWITLFNDPCCTSTNSHEINKLLVLYAPIASECLSMVKLLSEEGGVDVVIIDSLLQRSFKDEDSGLLSADSGAQVLRDSIQIAKFLSQTALHSNTLFITLNSTETSGANLNSVIRAYSNTIVEIREYRHDQKMESRGTPFLSFRLIKTKMPGLD